MRFDPEENLTVASPEVIYKELYMNKMDNHLETVIPASWWGNKFKSWKPWDWHVIDPPKPIPIKTIYAPEDISKVVDSITGGPQYSWRFPDDAVYYAATEEDKTIVQRVLMGKRMTVRYPYIKNKRDCEDFTNMGKTYLKEDNRTVHISTFDFHAVYNQSGKTYCHSIMGFPIVTKDRLSFTWRDNQNDQFFTWPSHWRLRLYRG